MLLSYIPCPSIGSKIKTCTAALMLSHKAWSGKSGNPTSKKMIFNRNYIECKVKVHAFMDIEFPFNVTEFEHAKSLKEKCRCSLNDSCRKAFSCHSPL